MSKIKSTRIVERLLVFIGNAPFFTLPEIQERLNIDHSTLWRWLLVFERSGWIVKSKNGREVFYLRVHRSPTALFDYLQKREIEEESIKNTTFKEHHKIIEKKYYNYMSGRKEVLKDDES